MQCIFIVLFFCELSGRFYCSFYFTTTMFIDSRKPGLANASAKAFIYTPQTDVKC